jgi:hypothetical protein
VKRACGQLESEKGGGLALEEPRLKHELFLDSDLLAKGQSR